MFARSQMPAAWTELQVVCDRLTKEQWKNSQAKTPEEDPNRGTQPEKTAARDDHQNA
jgi:hypothetical protein